MPLSNPWLTHGEWVMSILTLNLRRVLDLDLDTDRPSMGCDERLPRDKSQEPGGGPKSGCLREADGDSDRHKPGETNNRIPLQATWERSS
jgi:hypothetical protein